jgi:hypothetical protein
MLIQYPDDMGSLQSDASVSVQLNVDRAALRLPPAYKSSKRESPPESILDETSCIYII